LAEDRHWTFRDLVSTGSRSVQCQGYLHPISLAGELRLAAVPHSVNRQGSQHPPQPNATMGNKLFLQFTGQQIPLDDDLRQALPPPVQRAWQELHPTGNINLQAQVRHLTGSAKPTIAVTVAVTVYPQPESTAIKPNFFPYAMEKVEGKFTYQDGKIELSQMRAQHGRTSMRTNGNGEFRDDGSWHVQRRSIG